MRVHGWYFRNFWKQARKGFTPLRLLQLHIGRYSSFMTVELDLFNFHMKFMVDFR